MSNRFHSGQFLTDREGGRQNGELGSLGVSRRHLYQFFPCPEMRDHARFLYQAVTLSQLLFRGLRIYKVAALDFDRREGRIGRFRGENRQDFSGEEFAATDTLRRVGRIDPDG